MPPGDRPRLLVITPQGYEEIALGDELTVGRAFSSGLRLDGEEVSRLHARIVRRGTSYVLHDQQSRNGVEVNGRRVERHELEPDDVILIGNHFLIFEPTDETDLDEALERACALMDRKASEGAPTSREFQPGNEAFHHANLLEQIERSVLAFVEREVEPEDAVGDERRRLELLRAVAPFHKALFLAHATATEFPGCSDPSELCKTAARLALDVLGGGKALIMFRRDDGSDVEIGALLTRGEVRTHLITPAVTQLLLKERRAIVSGDVQRDRRIADDHPLLETDAIESLLGAPLVADGDSIGFIYLDSDRSHHRFSVADLKLLLVLGEHLAVHLARLL